MENPEFKYESFDDKYNKIKSDTRNGLNVLKDEVIKNKKEEDITFTPPSQDEDIKTAALLNDDIQKDALNGWYIPPSDVLLDEKWNPIY